MRGWVLPVMRRRFPLAAAAALLLIAGCGGSSTVGPTPLPPPGEVVLVGAGDIAFCSDLAPAEATAKLLDGTSGTIFTAGDNVQGAGSLSDYRDCFAPTWGRHIQRIRPSPGNHDYDTAGGSPYYSYFGSNAGSDLGYYSYDLGTWHIISLNSNIAAGPGSPQFDWLATDLTQTGAPCTLAYWHHPLFSSGQNGATLSMQSVWHLLYAYGVDVVLNGHDHVYERFGPQDANGVADAAHGIRQFTVGTGGAPLYPFVRVSANSEVRGRAHGILKLTLRSGSYGWEFMPVAGQSLHDAGSAVCH